LSDEVKDEVEEGVWGYLLPLDQKYGKSLVLRRRNACPKPDGIEEVGKYGGNRKNKNDENKNDEAKVFEKGEEAYEQMQLKGTASGGYLIGRHPECGK
jgi:serine/threonine-protein kinase Chk2